MKKLVQLLLIVGLLAGIMMMPATAQNGPPLGQIWPFLPPGASNVVTEGEPMTVIWAWFATSKGLVRVYIGASEHTYKFYTKDVWNEGEPTGPPVFTITPEMAEPNWGPLDTIPPDAVGLDCPGPYIWLSFWQYELPLDALVAGDYVMEVIEFLRHPVNDGLHTCTVLENGEPGEPAAPPPSLYPRGESILSVVDVTVLPPSP